MKNIGLSCIFGFLSVLINSLSVQALDFNFSIEGEEPSPGMVTGLIQGLKDNAWSHPIKVIIYANSLDVPVGTVLSDRFPNDAFNVRNGKIIDVRSGSFLSESSASTNYTNDYQIIFNGAYNWNGLWNKRLFTATWEHGNEWVRNYKGFSGVKYTPAGTKSSDITSKLEQYEVRVRLFIPSPALEVSANDTTCNFLNNSFCVFGGDNRRFSYNAPSHRYIANVIVTTESKNTSPIIGKPFRDFCPTKRYLSSQSSNVEGKPSWWLTLKPEAKPLEIKKLEFDSDVDKLNSVSAALVPGKTNTVKVSFKVHGSNPLVHVPPAPAFDADINVFIQNQLGKKPLVKVEGTHDGFPGYEIYVNRQLVYGYDPEKNGASLTNLLPPSDITISKPSTQWNPINNKYSEQKLPSCDIGNFSGFGGGSSGGGGAGSKY